MDRFNAALTRNQRWPVWPKLRERTLQLGIALSAHLPPYLIEHLLDFVVGLENDVDMVGSKRDHWLKIAVLVRVQKALQQ